MKLINKAIFLDRDGVINIDHGYVSTPEKFDFIEGVFLACLQLQRLGFIIIIVTNQSGIARGFYTVEQFENMTDWMLQQFAIHGVRISSVYYCPHYPKANDLLYSQVCNCRKPAPGMLLQAISEHNIDPKQSVMIGDKISDMQAAARAGIGFKILVGTSEKLAILDGNTIDMVCTNLLDASSVISKSNY